MGTCFSSSKREEYKKIPTESTPAVAAKVVRPQISEKDKEEIKEYVNKYVAEHQVDLAQKFCSCMKTERNSHLFEDDNKIQIQSLRDLCSLMEKKPFFLKFTQPLPKNPCFWSFPIPFSDTLPCFSFVCSSNFNGFHLLCLVGKSRVRLCIFSLTDELIFDIGYHTYFSKSNHDLLDQLSKRNFETTSKYQTFSITSRRFEDIWGWRGLHYSFASLFSTVFSSRPELCTKLEEMKKEKKIESFRLNMVNDCLQLAINPPTELKTNTSIMKELKFYLYCMKFVEYHIESGFRNF
jgi:hypothetical protein